MKRTTRKKVLTSEEISELHEQAALRDINARKHLVPEPTIFFSEGEFVKFGSYLKTVTENL